MSRVKSSQGRNKISLSVHIPNKKSDYISKSEKIRRFNQEMISIENFTAKENPDQLNVEQALTNFYEYALDSYKKKLYDNLIKELEINKNLLYPGNKESFDIVIFFVN